MKKLLALVLALVMTMSLVTISNAAFKDADKISNKEAVDVMAAVGVLAGYDNGEFGATDTLTRAQACKIIAYLDLGKDVAEALPAVQVFSDLPASNWAAKYVAYCADAGYVSGVGDNKFAPDEKVTGYQFGKMLLCALGYDATIEEMTGANWTIKVAKLMESNDISKGTSKLGSAALTREEAAQYALNALKATMVDYENKGTDINLGDIGSITVGASKAKAVESKNEAYKDALGNDGTIELGEKLYKGDLELSNATSDVDDFGRPGHSWTYAKADDTDIGTYASSADVKVVLTDDYSGDSYTSIVKVLVDELDKKDDAYKTASSVTYYLNGDDVTNFAGLKADLKDGTVVEAFYNDDNEIKAVAAYNYSVDKITDVDTDVSTADKKDDVTAYVEFDNLGSVKDTKITGYNAKTFVKDAWIAYVENNDGELIEAYPATVVEGSISTIKAGDYLTIDGTKYSIAAQAATGLNGLSVKKDDTYKVFVDKNGFAIGSDEVTSSTKLTDVYYVDQVWSTTEGDFGGSTNYYAQIVALDGTVQKIALENLAKGGNKTTDTYDTATYEGKLVTISDKKWKDADDKEHKANDKKYDLTVYTSNSDYDVDTSLTFGQFKKDTTRMSIGGMTYRFNDKTQYVMIAKTGADLTVTVKTGGVALATGKTGTIITEEGKSVALYVLVVSADKISETSTFDGDNLIYIKSDSSVKGDGYRVQEVYTATGEKTTMNIDEGEYTSTLAGKFYAYDTNDDGYIVLSADDAKALTIADANGVWDDEEGVVYGVKYVSLFNDLLTVKDSTKTYADINVSNVKFVDLHETDTDKVAKTYDRTVNTLKALDNIMTKNGNQYTVTELNMSVSKDGAIVIFLTKLEKA